ncbi:MAG: molybdopterin-synthase adenylyltransferase MoeB [Fulvivirga sp.]|nr:molybdopterin-synthase adenylyltransferase MoeB [Fulvivirga sp.]
MEESRNGRLSSEELKRYHRHFVLPEFGVEGQQKLKNSSVLVVGAGGLGSPVLLYLAAAGIGHLGIIDFDIIDESNLQRQVLFQTADLGKSKALTAKERLEKLNPHVNISVFNEKLTTENALSIIKGFDLVIDGTDNFPTRYLINDACVLCDKTFIYGSIFRYEGQVAVFNHKGSPHYRDLYPEPPAPEVVPDCEEGGVLGVLPGIIGSIQASEAIKLLTGVGQTLTGKLLLMNLLNLESRIIKIIKQPDLAPIEHLINYDEFCGLTKASRDMVKEITVKELNELRQQGEDFQLIDVREPHEREIANIEGELIPLGKIPESLDKIDKNKKVVVYCRSGARSAKAVEYIQRQLDIDNLYNLKGGILAWSNEIDPSIPKY